LNCISGGPWAMHDIMNGSPSGMESRFLFTSIFYIVNEITTHKLNENYIIDVYIHLTTTMVPAQRIVPFSPVAQSLALAENHLLSYDWVGLVQFSDPIYESKIQSGHLQFWVYRNFTIMYSIHIFIQYYNNSRSRVKGSWPPLHIMYKTIVYLNV